MDTRTCAGWLTYLDNLRPTADAWKDPDFVQGVSWVLMSFLWRRMNQKLIDAGQAVDICSPLGQLLRLVQELESSAKDSD